MADELPDDFVAGIHTAARAEKPGALLIGEVWEDGTTKIAYGVRRKHILGRHCDGLMNYPFRNAALNFLRGGDGAKFVSAMEALRENYPSFAFYSAMNSLGTHDTPRIITLLGVGSECRDQSKDWRACFRMSMEQYQRGKELLKVGAVLLYAFPGSPTVYYGDEAGLEGFEDPFNRRPYPWGREDRELVGWFAALGRLRKECPALRRGDIRYLAGTGHLLAFLRSTEGERLLTALNAGDEPAVLALPWTEEPERLLGAGEWALTGEGPVLMLPPRSGGIWRVGEAEPAQM